jgi:hypothetical protein
MYPASGICQRRRERRWLADKAKEGNVGNGTPTKVNNRSCGADPPKNESGRTIAVPSLNERRRYVRAGSGSSITAENLSNTEHVNPSKVISEMRSWYLSAAIMFSTPFSFSACQGKQVMAMGTGGQISSLVVGVLPL